MKEKKIGLKFNGKKSEIKVYDCNSFERFSGLMFIRKEKARILLFDFNKKTRVPIHSFFVFFNFIAIWLDDKNKTVDLKIVKPFSLLIKPKKPFNKLIEIPINNKHKEIVELFIH